MSSDPSSYYDPQAVAQTVARGEHREAIGGMWEEIGALQMQFLIREGLKPHHRLLDVGCGSLRLGVKAISYLDHEHYYGLDISEDLVKAGYDKELSSEQRAKFPWRNVAISDAFDVSTFAVEFDMAIAQSVFTHLPLNHIRRCLAMIAPKLKRGAHFYATAWMVPDAHPLHEPYTQNAMLGEHSITTYDTHDPYHYHMRDLLFAAENLPYQVHVIGAWGHPRHQSMLRFEKR